MLSSPPSAPSQVHKLKSMKWEHAQLQLQLQEGTGEAPTEAKGVSLAGENLPGAWGPGRGTGWGDCTLHVCSQHSLPSAAYFPDRPLGEAP